MIGLIRIGISLFPVFLFLAALIFLDSFKLVRLRSILQTIFIGCIVAVVCLFINNNLSKLLPFNISFYSRYIAPILEEFFKSLYIIYLIKSKRIGFLVDAAIYGFAIGAGFSLTENTYYLHFLKDPNLLLWLIRGFGTAVMHGGTTATFAILSKNLSDRRTSEKFYIFLPGLIVAIVVHSFFNHFFLSPLITTITQLIFLPLLTTFVFTYSEKALRDWLEVGLDTDARLLELITKGSISETKIGRYLYFLKRKFPGEIVADMLCFLRIHLELAIRAKGILLMQEAGFRIPLDPEIKEKFAELKYLEKSIGTTGKLAISPILHISTHDLWQLYLLNKV